MKVSHHTHKNKRSINFAGERCAAVSVETCNNAGQFMMGSTGSSSADAIIAAVNKPQGDAVL